MFMLYMINGPKRFKIERSSDIIKKFWSNEEKSKTPYDINDIVTKIKPTDK